MSIPFFIMTTIFIVIFQSVIYHKWGLSNIFYRRSFSQNVVFQGEKIEMIDEITNHKLLPVPWLRLESKFHANLAFAKPQGSSDIQDHEFHRTLFSLLPFQKITRRHSLTCTKRGYYPLKTVSITAGDGFGFGSIFKTIHTPTSITVYPEILPMDEIQLPSNSFLGDLVVKRWIIDDPFITAGVRKYSWGDPMNRVNWKATARTGDLQISKRDFTANHHLLILLNFDESEDQWMPIMNEERFEKGISLAASIAQFAISKGISTGFGCNSYDSVRFNHATKIKESTMIYPQGGRQQLTYIFETMAKLKIDRSMNFHHFLQEQIDSGLQGMDILLMTNIVTQNIHEKIDKLKSLGNSVMIVPFDQEEKAV